MKHSIRWFVALCLAGAAFTAGADESAQQMGGDLFIGGGSITVSQPVPGDLFASGGSVDVDAPVAGDVVAMGGKLRFGVDIGQSAYAAGGQVTLNGKVGRNARAAGGQLEFGPSSEVAGNVSALGGQVRLLGRVGGHLQAAGGRVLIDGPVGGDVTVGARQLELGPKARIAGTLRYRSGGELQQDPAAQVVGGIEKLAPRIGHAGDGRPRERADRDTERDDDGAASVGIAGVWTLGLMLVAGVLLAALPRFYGQVERTLLERAGQSLLLGFVLLVCVPVAVVLLMVTLVGLPLALLTLALYLVALPVAYVSAAIGVGNWALRRWRPALAESKGWRIGAACAVLVVLALLGWVPVLGGLVGFLAMLAGLGALVLQLRRPAPVAT